MKISLFQKGKDYFGYFWWIKIGKRKGISIRLFTEGIDLLAGVGICWREENQYIDLKLFNLNITLHREVDWE